MNKRFKLANIARNEALKCFHGAIMQTESNLSPIIEPWIIHNKWSLEEADGK